MMVKEKTIEVGILYNAFDPSQIEKHELVYRKNTNLKTYLRDLPTDCEWKIGVNGKPMDLVKDGKYKVKAEDTIQLVVVPRGGGAKNILRMVAMVALVVVAAAAFGPGGFAVGATLFGMSAGATAMVFMAATVMAGGLLINALLPPTMPKTDSEDSTSYGYDGAKNTAKEGVPLPVVYGKYRVAGNYINIFTENVGDDQYLYGRTVLSDGEIQNVSDPYLNDQPISNYTNVDWGWRAGTPTEEINEFFSRSISQVNKGIKLTGGGGTWVTHTTTEEITQFQLNLLFSKGLVHITKKKGKKESRTAQIRVQYRKQGDAAWTNWPTATYTMPNAWINAFTYANTSSDIYFADKRVKQIRKTLESPILEPAIYEIRINKMSGEGDQEYDIDELYLADVGEITTQKVNHRHVANAYYRIKMNEQLNGIPNITWLTEGVKVNKYDINGNVTVKEWSDNPAWIVLDMLIGEERGTPEIFNIDFHAFVEWADWCETEGYKFNGVFDSTTTLWDACVEVLKVGHAAFSRIGTKLSLAIDKPQQPVMLFGPANIHKGTFAINYISMNDRANEFELSYFDKDDLNQQKTIRVTDPDADIRGDIPRAVAYSMPGIDNFEQAQKEIWYQLYNNRYIRRIVSFEAPIESIGLGIGDVALIQHDIVNWGVSGRLASGSTNSVIKLDRNVLMEDNQDYSILIINNTVNRATGTVVSNTGSVVTIEGITNTSISQENVKRLVQNGVDREVIALNVVGTTAYVTISGDNDFVNGSVTFVDTDVIEERDVVYDETETDTVSVVGGFSFTPQQYSNFMFGVKEIVKKPYRLKGMSGSGFDQRKLTFVEYNEAIYNPPETIVPFPTTTQPKNVLHVRNLAFANDTNATYDNNLINGVITWQSGHIKKYGGADIYVSINDGEFEFYQTVFNTNAATISVQKDTDIIIKVVAFNDTLTRALSSTAPTLNLLVNSVASEIGVPHTLAVEQISYIATALVQLTWQAPVDLIGDEVNRVRYRVQVQPDGETFWDEYGVTDQQLIRIGDLVVGTHSFRVRAEIDSAVSEWSSIDFTTFTTEYTLNNDVVLDDTPPAVPTALAATSQITPLGAKITWTWTAPADTDLAGYVLAVKETASGNYVEYMTSTNSHEIDGLNRNTVYVAKVKAFDKVSNYSGFTAELSHTTTQDTVAPAAPTAAAADVSLSSVFLRWNNADDSDLAGVQIWESTSNNPATAIYYVTVNAIPSANGAYTRTGLQAGVTRYFFLKSIDSSGNTSDFSSPVQVTIPSLSEVDFTPTASSIAPVILVDTLPTTGNYVGRVAMLKSDGKLYRYTSTGWTTAINIDDVSGEIVADDLVPGIITSTDFANDIQPLRKITSLSEAGSVNEVAIYTVDNKLYRHNGSTWVKNVDAVDISGELNANNIGNNTITNEKLVDGLNAVLTVNTLPVSAEIGQLVFLTTNSKLYRYTSTGWTQKIETVDLDGQLTTDQIQDDAITIDKFAANLSPVERVTSLPTSNNFEGRIVVLTTDSKIYRYIGGVWTSSVGAGDILGKVQSSQIQDLNATQLVGQITETQITDSSISTVKLKASAITADKIAANSITASHMTLVGGNLWPDSQIQDIKWWKGPSQGTGTDGGYVNPANPDNTSAASWQLISNVGALSSRVGGSKGYWQLWSDGGFTSDGMAQVVPPSIMAKPLTTYELGIGCTNGSNKICQFNVQYFDANGNYLTGSNEINWSAGDYTTIYYRKKFTTPANTASIRVYWEVAAGDAFSGFICVGNISLREAASASMIVDGSITTQLMTANSINGDRIAANTLQANKIVAGSIQGDRIAANTISAKNLLIADYTNMIDFGFNEGVREKWNFLNEVNFYQDSEGYSYESNGRDCAYSSFVPVIANEAYNVSARVYNTDPDWGANLYVMYADNEQGANPTSWIHSGAATAVKNTWVDFSANVTAQKRYMRVLLQNDKPSANGYNTYWQRPSLRRAANATLIVDGSISANKIQANSIGASKIVSKSITANEIAANTITASEIAANTIEAGNIKGSTITSDKIATNTITANKMVVASRPVSAIGFNFRVGNDGILSWDAGTIAIYNSAGTYTHYSVGSGSVSWPGTNGYVYYELGGTNFGFTTDSWVASGYEHLVHVATWTGNKNIDVKIGAGTILNGDRIVTGSINANKIVAYSITADQMASNSIKTVNLDAEAVTADKIKVGTITSNQIAANTIKTSNLLVVPASLCPDPYFNDIDFWSEQWDNKDTTGWYIEQYNGGVAAAGSRMVTLWSGRNGGPGTTRNHIYSRTVACPTPGTKIRLKASIENVSNQWCDVVVQFFDANSNFISGGTGVRQNAGTSGVITSQSEVPVGATKMRWVIYNAGTEGPALDGYMRVSGVILDIAASSELIVDGAITTDKLAANSVNASKIVANAITSNKLTLATRPVSTVGMNFRVDNDGIMRWDGGTIHYPDANGNYISENIAAGQASYGGLFIYFIYTPGRGIIDYGTDANLITSQNSFQIATWQGGTALTVKSGFGTILNGDRIVTGSIHANRIVAGTITGGMIQADSITAAQIQAGAISASEIASGAITTNKLAIVPAGYNPDPYFVSGNDFWDFDGNGWGINATTATAGIGITRWVELSDSQNIGAARRHIWSKYTENAPSAGEVLRIRARFENNSNQNIYAGVRFCKTDGTEISGYDLVGEPGYTYIREGQVTVPEQTTKIRYVIYNRAELNNFTGWARVGALQLDIAASANLIVDGSITASKIIASGITGDVITAGTLNANRLATNTSMPGTIQVGTTGVTIETIKNNTDSALNALNIISSDGWLSKSEKPDIIKLWNALSGAVAYVSDQAGQAGGVSVTGMVSARDALAAYLGALSPAWNDTNSDTPIDGAYLTTLIQDLDNTINDVRRNISNKTYGFADNPANVINNRTTTIDPGKILISGGTTLASWRFGGDTTQINGGVIAANTIAANKLTIGNRGINFSDLNFSTSGNTVTWQAGAVYYMNDSNVIQGIGLTGGSATWSGNEVFIWWNKGGTQLYAGTTWNNNPDDVLVAIYHGGNNINANYGRTIVNGDYIQTGTVHANRIQAGTITATQIQAASISADRLSIESLSAISGTIGLLRTATTGARMELESNQLRCYDANGTLRVRLGVW